MQINISLQPDEKGYIDRKCPCENCGFIFKVKKKDLLNMKEMYCPLCGYKSINSVNEWITEEQYNQALENAKSYAYSYMQKEINKMFSNLARNNHSKYCKITYKPSRPISYVNNPILQREKWTLEIKCEDCGTEYSVIGNAYFCPNCGHNNILKNINKSLDTIENMVESQYDIYNALIKINNKDLTTAMCQKLLESSLKDVVSAFQSFAFEVFNNSNINVKVCPNDFQIVSKGNKLFEDNFNKKYEDYISINEINKMNIMFNQRHLLEHRDGIVDQKYLDKTNDLNYKIGQRVVIKSKDIKELLNIVRKLCNGLK